MKRIVTVLALLLAGMGAWAQNLADRKLLESNIQLGAGLFAETGAGQDIFPGAALRLSYGLDVRISEHWSVMPGAGIRTQGGPVDMMFAKGGDGGGMSMADVFCQARYHFASEGTKIVLGLGPQLSFMTHPDYYYRDADPSDPINGKERFKDKDIALQPSIVFQTGKHFQWGFDGSVGLLNMMRQYPEYNKTGNIHLMYLLATCGWRF